MDLAAFSSFLQALYDAAIYPSLWEGLAERLADLFGAESSALHLRNSGNGVAHNLSRTANYTPELIEAWRAYFYRHDEYVKHVIRQPFSTAYGSDDLITDDELSRTEFWNDFCRHLGVFYVIGAAVPVARDGIVGVVGLHRPRHSGLFDRDSKRYLTLLMPHFQRGLQMHQQLAEVDRSRQFALEALEALAVGIVVVGGGRRILFANVSGERHLRTGEAIVTRQGQLHARDTRMDQALHQALQSARLAGIGRSLGAGGVLALPRSEGRPLSLLICPLRPGAIKLEPPQPCAMVFIGDPDEQRQPSRAALAQFYSLTPAEARLTEALLEGERIQDYSERVGISIHTAKAQLKQVFAKTGHNRQSDLIRDALMNPILKMSRRPPEQSS